MSVRWTDSELISALALYYQIPFASIDRKNPAIISLAAELGRTPDSISLKLANFASLDPTIVASGRRGMKNVSKDDRRVFDECAGHWETLRFVLSEPVLEAIERRHGSAERSAVADAVPPMHIWSGETEGAREVPVRRGQTFFRNAILAAYRIQCCITGMPVRELLRASHIIPWAADPTSRLDPRNGLCLNALHDAAFDRGLITLTDNNRLLLARTLRDRLTKQIWSDWFGRYDGVKVTLPERLLPRPEALAYHRESVFVG